MALPNNARFEMPSDPKVTTCPMGHSTTTTSSYILKKYSRSYPTTSDTYSDWQHFTNPEILLALDVTKSTNSELQQVRLRVSWNINNGLDDQSQVVFEDIELLSFSSLARDKSIHQNQQLQCLPIKAVYRDNLVGIRYLHPKDSINTNPTYRRFQITFASHAVTTEFINSICTICPCKLNPACAARPNLAQAPGPSSTKTMDPRQPPPEHNGPVVYLPPSVSACRAFPENQTFQIPVSSPHFTASSQQEKEFSQFTSSPANIRSGQPQQLCHTPGFRPQLGSQWIPDRHEIEAEADSNEHHSQLRLHQPSWDTEASGSLLPSSKNDELAGTANTKMGENLLSALDELQATDLYELSSDALEQLVGEIVHENGFPKLLRSLEKLWAIKDLAKFYV